MSINVCCRLMSTKGRSTVIVLSPRLSRYIVIWLTRAQNRVKIKHFSHRDFAPFQISAWKLHKDWWKCTNRHQLGWGVWKKNAFKDTWKVWIFRGTQFSRIGGVSCWGEFIVMTPRGLLGPPKWLKMTTNISKTINYPIFMFPWRLCKEPTPL